MTVASRIDHIVDIVDEIETEDPIDWGLLNISEANAYKLIALNVISHFDKYSEPEDDVMIATVTKLIVDNFVLNLKLQKLQGN